MGAGSIPTLIRRDEHRVLDHQSRLGLGYCLTEINSLYLESSKGREYISETPAQRVGEMREIEAPFMLLASEAGSFINGVALPVDGGHMLAGI